MECPDYTNPADFFLHSLILEINVERLKNVYKNIDKNIDDKVDSKRLIEEDIETGNKGRIETGNKQRVQQKTSNQNKEDKLEQILQPIDNKNVGTKDVRPYRKKYIASYLKQFKTLYMRQTLITWTSFNPQVMFLPIFTAILIGFIWFRLNLTDSNIFSKNSSIFLTFIWGVGFMHTIIQIGAFLAEKAILIKEYGSGSYNLVIYFIAKRLAEIPFELPISFIYANIIYWLVKFRPDPRYFIHIIIVLISGCISSVLGIFYAAVAGETQGAFALQTVVSLVFLLTMGYYIPIGQLPGWIRWCSRVTFYRYGYEAIIINEYIDRNVTHELASSFLSANNLQIIGNSTSFSYTIVLDQLGIHTSLLTNALVTLGFLVFYHVLGFLSILFLVV